MKKLAMLLSGCLLTVLGAAQVSAAAIPPTGEKVSPLPYVLVGVAVVLILAVVVLTILDKKKKK